MKVFKTSLFAILIASAGEAGTFGQAPPGSPANPSAPSASPAAPTAPASGTATAAAADASAPPSAPPQRSEADLEKLVAPIALYPDALVATVLPASAYPLEVVQAARFVKDTNNISKIDSQNWDENVKAVAHFPDVINQMNDNVQWTSDLGDAFINQPKGVTDAIQTMRTKAQQSGALKTTPQQVVTVTNTIVTNTIENKTAYVTNQLVQIQPAQPDVMYVPQYNPTVVYAGYPVAYPGYYYPPPPPYGSVLAASAISFGVGMACGAIIANNCDWGHGGCWGGSYNSSVNINRNVNVNNNFNRNNVSANVNRQKWQPDQNRLRNSGSLLSSSQSRDARGWNTASTASARAAAGESRPTSTARTGSGVGAGNTARAGSGAGSSRLSPTGPAANRPSPSGIDRSPNVSGPSSSPNVSRPSSESSNRPSSSERSAFSGGGNAMQTRQASERGSMSRGGGGGFHGGGGRR